MLWTAVWLRLVFVILDLCVAFSYRLSFFCKQKTAYEMRISDWSSDVCSSDLLILALAALAFFALAPGMIERGMNQIDGKPLPQVSARAQALHKTLTIVDLHSDTLLWKRNILDRAERGDRKSTRLNYSH